ncbi:homologous-pairing protein 2 homolog [Copidosoma floridanum]|uniref:homologous-pairing protein 2 homolog n=1 Tax=Copidosoma floridanum TaxID=29053 RepID=UPI0006C961E4|nr:homologous-pairing protein 2 homolog [Copidosoma floridanum]XP_014207206.1 homologous-pairing protein 2 homolog [Copidosoma floridanum]
MTTEAVYRYMKLKNRPFSANDVANALEKEHNKSATQKALEKLADHEKIFVKINGKQKVYCAKQDTKQNLEELKMIERELESHASEQNRKLQELEKEVKAQESALNSLKCGMSLEEAVRERNRLKESNAKFTAKLDELMESSGKQDLSGAKKKAEKDLKFYSQEYSKRKRMCNEILECIMESYPGSKNQLYQDIGITSV